MSNPVQLIIHHDSSRVTSHRFIYFGINLSGLPCPWKQERYKSPSSEEFQPIPQLPEEGRKKLLIFLQTEEMILPVVFLCLTAVLSPCTGQGTEALHALSPSRVEQQKLIVDRHNALRRGVKPTASNMMKMGWCPPAAVNAQNWANQCTLRHSPPNLRRTNVQCGENLFMSSAPFSWSDVLQAWYNEEKNFEYGTGAKPKGAMVGHYTQVQETCSYSEVDFDVAIVRPGWDGAERQDCHGNAQKYRGLDRLEAKLGSEWNMELRKEIMGYRRILVDEEMDLLTAIIFLAALVHQSDGQGFPYKKVNAFSFPHFKSSNEKQILELHNEIRRAVIPTARNMLKMVWSEKAAKNAQKWANQCGMKVSPRDKRVINGVTCGENVLLSSYPRTWADTIQVWHSQSSNFKYGYGAISKNINVESYTQPTLASIKTSLETAGI
ncbi:hypothetical protein HGM15179_009582 [Zosterops borbonicus]|uniref:SCP domain-containing protein n=1 Tax=Zosterops borbonicus TaxID=364589 RepID=A0A8K1GFJ6_9PASS|nr:hypothetical protein HGM15179_009582 [Zosterops borbonicus]